jgi:NAD-specific glutamate dehydrogenase
VDDRASFLEEGAAVLHFCTTARTTAVPDPAVLGPRSRSCRRAGRTAEAALAIASARARRVLADRYTDGYPEPLRVATHPVDAGRGVVALEALAATGLPHFALYFDHGDERREITSLDIFLGCEPLLLSDLLPFIDGFGIRVVDAQQLRVTPADRPPAMVATLRVLPLGADQADLDAIADRLGDAIRAVLLGAVASDPLNGLVLGAGLAWREIDCMRAYSRVLPPDPGGLPRDRSCAPCCSRTRWRCGCSCNSTRRASIPGSKRRSAARGSSACSAPSRATATASLR